jgi:hypothetical protein
MTIFKRFLALSAVLLLTACGGGGGGTPFGGGTPGGGGGGGSPGTPGTPVTPIGAPELTIGLSSTTISAASPGVVTATLTDARNQPVAGQVVEFNVVRALAETNVATALTNSQGRAVVTLSPVATGGSGADEVIARASYAGTSLTALAGFQVQATDVTIQSFSSDISSVSAGGETTLTLTLAGVSLGVPVNVSLTSSCVAQGRATLSPSTLTVNGSTATARFLDNGCGALAQSPATAFTDTVQATVVGSATSRSLTLNVARPEAANIAFVRATPEVIFLRGSGFVETSQVRFQVQDRNGNPLPRQDVTLTLLTSAGGVTAQDNTGNAVGANVPVTRATDDQGFVELRINSGSVPTPVRVEASVSSFVKTVSSNLSVAVGLPSQLNFSLSQGTRNIEGYNIDGTPNTYQIIAADRSGNPVPAGTSINFIAEGGQIEAVKQTQLVNGIARTTANFVSAEPRPVDGRVTITVYALGEESFIDLNGNNAYDPGEPFQDLGNIFKDRRFNGVFNANEDEFIPLNINNSSECVAPASPLLLLDASIPSVPGSCSGNWSGAGQVYVRRAVETVLSTSAARPLWANTSGLTDVHCLSPGRAIAMQTGPESSQTHTFVRAGGDTWHGGIASGGTLSFIVGDANPGRESTNPSINQLPRLNPMAAGTTITASTPTPGLTVSVAGGTPVPSTTSATGTSVIYNFTDPAVTSGVVLVNFLSPSGTITTIVVNVARSALPSAACSIQ